MTQDPDRPDLPPDTPPVPPTSRAAGAPPMPPAAPGLPPSTPPLPPSGGAAAAPLATSARKPAIPWLKEGVGALIAVAVAVVTLVMLFGTFRVASEQVQLTGESVRDTVLYEAQEKMRLERKSSQKDILLIATSLFGIVLGYYFGRVPAERQADQAAGAAATAQANANAAQATANGAVNSAATAQSQLKVEQQRREAVVADTRKTLSAVDSALATTMRAQRKTLGEGGEAPVASPEILEASVRVRELLERLG